MKKILIAGITSFMLSGGFGLQPIHANEKMAKTPAEQQKKISEHLDKMTKDLKLSVDQQESVRVAMQMKMDKMMEAKEEFDQSVRSILNPEQVKKYDAMQEKK